MLILTWMCSFGYGCAPYSMLNFEEIKQIRLQFLDEIGIHHWSEPRLGCCRILVLYRSGVDNSTTGRGRTRTIPAP